MSTRTRRSCYIVTSFWAYGELHMALDFAARQRAAGIEPVFVIPPSHGELTRAKQISYETLIPGSGKLNTMLLSDVQRRFRPEAVILADFLNYSFCERHYGLTLDSLDVFDAPISAFDIYDFGQTGGRVDTYGFFAKGMRTVSTDRYHRLLQPSPIVPPDPPRNERIIKYPLFENLDRYGSAEREQARRQLGFGAKDRVVLVTSALWQQTHHPYRDVLPFIAACAQTLDEILARVARDAVIVSVGASGVGESREIPGLRRFGSLPADDFDRIAAACDLYVSNNYISTSMARLAMKGMPTLLISNSVSKHPDGSYAWLGHKGLGRKGSGCRGLGCKGLGHKESGRDDAALPPQLASVPRAYPFRMYPVGWHAFLRPVVRHNDFYRIMRHAELFDVDECVESIVTMLDGADTERSTHAVDRYRTQLDKLPTAAEIDIP